MRLLPHLVIALACLVRVNCIFAELSNGENHIVVDGVRFQFDEEIEVDGVVKPDRARWYSGEPEIEPWRIGGKPTQEHLTFLLDLNNGQQEAKVDHKGTLKPGEHYHIRGKLLNARFNGLDNVCWLQVSEFRTIPETHLKVADFIDRSATFEGIAATSGKLKYGNELVEIEGIGAWPQDIEGKHVLVSGTVRGNSDALKLEGSTWKLYRLDEMVNRPVMLEGRIGSLNDHWWFDYRGERLYLTSKLGPVLRFDSSNHYRAVKVSGQLVRQDRPSLDQITLKEARDLVPTYVVRDAKVESIERRSTWDEKFGTVYRSSIKANVGVPELLAEASLRRNLFGNETEAMLFVERNSQVIHKILQEASKEHFHELARRMTDKTTNAVLRLIYAAILAGQNDERGRTFLLNATKVSDGVLDLNAIYCLGVFPRFSGDKEHKVDIHWARQRMIELVGMRESVTLSGRLSRLTDNGREPVSAAVAIYSHIPALLRQIGSDDCRDALMEFLYSMGEGRQIVAVELCNWNPPLPAAELLKIDELLKDGRVHRLILRQCLLQKLPDVVQHFSEDLKDGFIYMDFRDHLSPEIVNQLKLNLGKMNDEASVHARVLIALGQHDPVAELLKLLDDPKWANKNIVFFELSRLGDPRAVNRVSQFLRNSPKSAVVDDGGLSATNTVKHAIRAIAHAGTPEAIQQLVELLPVDLARFGGYIKREEWPLIIAAHLIELTGESFGTDVDKWRDWQSKHPEHMVPPAIANPSFGFRTNSNAAIDLGN